MDMYLLVENSKVKETKCGHVFASQASSLRKQSVGMCLLLKIPG